MSKKQKKDKKKQEISKPHDITFKKLFSQPSIARDLIVNHLSKEIISTLDLSTLELIDGTFISESLKGSFSDLMFRVTAHGEEAYIALLLEHKSYQDKLTALQVARYMIDFWSRTIVNGGAELPLIVPIVVYHGRERWNHKTDLRDLIKNYNRLPTSFKERLPVFKHDLINIQAQNEKDMYSYKPMTRIVVRSFKYIFHDLDQLMESFLISVDELSKQATDEDVQQLVDILLLYFHAANQEFKEEKLMKKIHELDGKGEQVMTILQERERRGLERGLEQGLEQGRMEEKIVTIKNLIGEKAPYLMISKATGFTVEEVKEIEKEMKR